MHYLRRITVRDCNYAWDAVSNLTEVRDVRLVEEWPEGYRPYRQVIEHDALYRVTNTATDYASSNLNYNADDAATDWREERTAPNDDGSTHRDADPMRRDPAPMVSSNAPTRVRDLTYDYDWLANMVEWTDDQSVFYERSAGDTIVNGADNDESVGFFMPRYRPSALYLSTNIRGGGAR